MNKVRRNIIISISIFFLLFQPTLQSSLVTKEFVSKSADLQAITNDHPDLIQMIEQVNTTTLKTYIQTIQDFGPHPTGSDAIDYVGEYLYNELSTMNVNVTYDSWEYEEKSGNSIIATHPGKQPDGIVIVCAHYDTLAISPGADDDGSGVAGVLMMAKIMSEHTFNATVKFILFSGEEQGLLGSLSYAQKAREQDENIIGVLALDKIGYANNAEDGRIIRHHADIGSDWMIEISKDISQRYEEYIDLEVISFPFDPSSDHKAFVDYGYDGSNLVEQTLNPYYHTSEDLLEHMNLTYLTNICKLTVGVISTIAHINPKLKSSDLQIQIRGPRFTENSQFSILIINNNHQVDTANVTISITMKHLFRKTYVTLIKDFYDTTCSWNFTKEIDDYWEFDISGRKYSRGLFELEVTVIGINDDLNLYAYENTFGIIIRQFTLRMLPRL